jgi:MFS family permease
MQFMLAFRYILDRRGGFLNLFMIVVCQFIPILGPIVLLGYRAEVAVALDRDPDMRRHPKFDFNRFGEYLNRGIWPFLIGLILALPFIPIMIGAFVVGFAISPPGPNNPPFLAFGIYAGAFFLSMMVMLILSVPMTFHCEIVGRFDIGGAFRFALSFWNLVGGAAFGTGLVFMFLSMALSILGLLCCFVGIYPVHALIQMASQHLMVQLYRVYLDRGGEPLPECKPYRRLEDEYDYEDDDFEDEDDDFEDEDEGRRERS